MKLKLISALFSIMLFSVPIICFAQDDRVDSYEFDTEELQTNKRDYFVLGGGVNVTPMMMNFDEINNLAAKLQMDKKFDGQMWMLGFQAFSSIIVVENVRLGFQSQAGSKTLEKDLVIDNKNLKRTMDLNLSTTNFSLEYSYTPMKSLAIMPGVGLGWGSMTIENYQNEKDFDFNNINAGQDQYNYFNKAKNNFMFVTPSINIEYALTGFSIIRFGAGYTSTFANPLATNEWEYNQGGKLNNVPDKLNANGFYAQIGVFVGLFNY